MTDLLETPQRNLKARGRQVAITGIGTAVPPSVCQRDAIEIAEGFGCNTDGQRAWLRRIFSRSGVDQRGCVLMGEGGIAGVKAFYRGADEGNSRGPTTAQRMQRYAQEAPPLAQRAAAEALAASGLEAADITHLITVSCTGFHAPGLDTEMITRLGLRPDVRRIHLGFMGCHAAFNAMGAARDAVLADADAQVLVVSVELSTLHFAYGWHPEKLVANALFADGASACVVGAAETSRDGGWRVAQTASLLLPASRDAMTWHIGDNGFEMTLSSELPGLIGRHLRPWCEEWLGKAGLALSDIHYWALHPGGPKILAAGAESLGLSEDDVRVSREVLAAHGNMSSATVLFLLRRIAEEIGKQVNDSDGPRRRYGVAIGFGPGLMAEGMLLVTN